MIEERRKTITLSAPARVGDREIRELNLVPPQVGWRLRASRFLRNGEHSEALTQYNSELIARCANVDPAVIEACLEPDAYQALQWVQAFGNEPHADAEPGEFTRTVEFPQEIKIDNRAYTELVLGRTTVGQRRQAEGHLRNGVHPEALTNYAVALVSKSAAVDQKVILAIDDDVFFNAWWFIVSFLPGGPAITTA